MERLGLLVPGRVMRASEEQNAEMKGDFSQIRVRWEVHRSFWE